MVAKFLSLVKKNEPHLKIGCFYAKHDNDAAQNDVALSIHESNHRMTWRYHESNHMYSVPYNT